ncbi:MAG: hypothetical protein PUC65_13275 [Clostridiales bacterium]|nr:hypothetical protein [Clostridiales bacterium]
MQIEINPLENVVIDGKVVELGMKKNQVISILGKGELSNRHYYYGNELAIDYDKNDSVEFIEFLGGMEGTLHPVIYGIPAFECNADELCEVLKVHNNGEIVDIEDGFSYGFVQISVGIYRTATPESIKRDIEEMKRDGVYDQEYVDEESMKANHWATIGIGKANYYKHLL